MPGAPITRNEITLADYIRRSITRRVGSTFVCQWPDAQSAHAFAQNQLPQALKGTGVTLLVVSLEDGESPSQSLLDSLRSGRSMPEGYAVENFNRSISAALVKRWRKTPPPTLLFLEGVDRWQGAHWRADVAAIRSVLQARRGELGVVFNCVSPVAVAALFQDYHEPLFSQGMLLRVSATGSVL